MAKRRPSGDGMVRKRDDGRWEGRIVVGHKENGDSIFHYVYAPTQKELSVKLRQEINAYQGVDLTEDSSMTLGDWLDRWLDGYMAGTVRPSTLQAYRRYADLYIKPTLGDRPLNQITPAEIQKLYAHLKKRGRVRKHKKYGQQLSDSMVHCIHTLLYGAMGAAEQFRLIPRNPVAEVTVPKRKLPPKQILNVEQLDTFMAAIQADDIWHDFFYTELTTGLRLGEICGLRWEDFDAEHGVLNIQRTVHVEKGGVLTTGDTKTYAGTRKIVLPASTVQCLRERKEAALTDWIFPNPLKPELPVNPRAAYSRLKVLLKDTGLPSIRFHDLRHTFSTTALEHGMDIKTLSTIIGHVSSSTTLNIYAHVTDEMRRTAAVKIDQGISKTELQAESQLAPRKPAPSTFQAHKGQRRKAGTGCVTQINERLWEGRYSPIWPDGKKRPRNIYAHSEEECEKLLAEMIAEMKTEIAAERERLKSV